MEEVQVKIQLPDGVYAMLEQRVRLEGRPLSEVIVGYASAGRREPVTVRPELPSDEELGAMSLTDALALITEVSRAAPLPPLPETTGGETAKQLAYRRLRVARKALIPGPNRKTDKELIAEYLDTEHRWSNSQ